ncbi:transporter substrate-binding domain-containing protein [Phaeobacter gallaeciensis]|uniref:transporter substrate-binding domain-containing protein n=1 Tax=Phaeobacter gallaeciensis TaxID=60890 RepID=UPI000BBB78DC|nr:transporter substrate-binding domain-containing protein [Phaeobacter gallaeciensis]ATF17281.1 amino acid-binding protein domain protein sensor hybrid histidine kinase [Phaeobacter gallaeciensis]ATF21390.1 amino acid-binding protein domain protein sensor hybrid histidine kinase [Phaeobacter gallaeciensis]
MARPVRFLLSFFVLTILALPCWSQDAPDPLRIGFLPVPPFAQRDDQGEETGLLVAFAQDLATELGTSITLVPMTSSHDFVQGQADGRTDLIAGVARLPALQNSNLFSTPISSETLRPMVRTDMVQGHSTATLSGVRVGIVPPAVGSEQEAFLARNTTVNFTTAEAAIMALLLERIDAVLIPEPVAFSIAKSARVDGRVRFLNPPLREFNRFVALHESRAELMPDIETALQKMKADRRLDVLLKKYFLDIPLPAPEVLRVGVRHSPPCQIVGPSGEFSGFGVEVLRQLARQTGLELTFQQISEDEWQRGPQSDTYDLLPADRITPERQAQMDYSHPVLAVDQSVYTRPDDAEQFRRPQDLSGRRVAVRADNAAALAAGAAEGWQLVTVPRASDLMAALWAGQVDAIVDQPAILALAASSHSDLDTLSETQPALLRYDRAPALRFGLGEVRDKLDLALSQYLVSTDYTDLRRKYFEPPVFWTSQRLSLLGYALGGGLMTLLGVLGMHQLRTRRRAAGDDARRATEIAEVRDELEVVLNAATSGIIAFDRTGQIIRINHPARHMLGDTSAETPFVWPKAISFLDTGTLTPLDASADPLQRARSGHVLSGETHLLRRSANRDDHRYVRVRSAVPKNEQHGVALVLVLDDVTSEERNRQVNDRRNRLDALGELTGGIAHDINNLLASLLYAVDLAGSATTADQRARFLGTATTTITRGRRLTTRLLAFAKRQPGFAMAKPVQETLAEFHELIRPMLESRIEIEVLEADPDLLVYCDPAQLETALMNLVLNSRDAIMSSGDGSCITLRARSVPAPQGRPDTKPGGHDRELDTSDSAAEYRYVELSVTDDGPGMNDATLTRCTDPFFTTKDGNSGTGLGLSMVYGFARHSNGDLRVYSQQGSGTTVQLTLPRSFDLSLSKADLMDAPLEKGTGEIILLAEDEPDLRLMTRDMLVALGYCVLPVGSAQQALELMQDGSQFDLLLTDVVMPGTMGGFELANRIRQVHPTMPVIYTSGFTGYTPDEMGPVTAPLLQKPVHPRDLAAALAAALQR